MNFRFLIEAPWVIFCAYWAIAALKTRRAAIKEQFAWRYSVMALEIAGFVLVFDNDASIGVLGRRMMPSNPTLTVIGLALVWMGIALAIWARWHLGQYWSGRITIKEGHKLIRTGPYARLRHPIYSGLDLAVVGSALALNRWRCVVGLAVIVFGFWIKAWREEQMLGAQFGDEFRQHQLYTGFLLPRLRRSEEA